MLPNWKLYGFDSFLGLQENWGDVLPRGAFSTGGDLPKVAENVTLIPGWFHDTLPKFLEILGNQPITLLHMDADTYESTKFVLTKLSANIKPGTVIIFDEYYGYSPEWHLHEYKAFNEFCSEFDVKYRALGYTNIAVAFLIS